MAIRPDEVEARRSVSGAQATLVVLGLVVLLGLLWFLFLRGDSEVAPAVAPPAAAPAPTPEATAEAPAAKPGKGPLETFEVFAPKDPFKPLISAAGAGGTSAAGAPAPVTSPGATTGGQPSGGSDISGGQGGDSVGGHRVRLIDTFTRNGEPQARVQVDGTVYTVGEGDRFADNFEVLSISGQCASLLFGDDQFSLCEGEEILK
jgi:hypothetical protein